MESPRRRRSTAQRATVLQTLMESAGHLTAEEVYDRIRQTIPHMSLATVYRNLRFLEREGLIQEVDVGGRAARFDARLDPHHHVRCVECGRVSDVSLACSTELETAAAAQTGYRISGCRVQFTGLCPDCLKNAAQ